MFSSFFSSAPSSRIRLIEVSLGERSVRIPVAEIVGASPGKSLLVTAGMDGDEYAGIEAAYSLIEAFSKREFAGRLVIVPVVNIPGFEAECSQNPMDQKFPKHIFPGKADGLPTERLMHWLATSYVQQADCWYDLHAGAITEGLQPFLWLHGTGISTVDFLSDQMLQRVQAEIVVFEKAHLGSKPARLARQNCTYMLAESGGRGGRFGLDVDRHLAWVQTAMQLLNMIPREEIVNTIAKTILRHVAYTSAPFDGIWRPTDFDQAQVVKGDILGECCRLDGTGQHVIRAACDGERLWWKETMAMRRGDSLYAIGRP